MPRQTITMLLGYAAALQTAHPDTPDLGDEPAVLIFNSPERDDDGDSLDIVQFPMTVEARQAIGRALLGVSSVMEDVGPEEPDADTLAEMDARVEAPSEWRCRVCGDWVSAQSTGQACAAQAAAITRTELEAMSERGCPAAQYTLNSLS
jgi:hypothetical protein